MAFAAGSRCRSKRGPCALFTGESCGLKQHATHGEGLELVSSKMLKILLGLLSADEKDGENPKKRAVRPIIFDGHINEKMSQTFALLQNSSF